MYLVDLSEIDLKSGSYTADFYLWVRWEGPDEATNFEIMNGVGEPCSTGLQRQQGTVKYVVYRCLYRFHGNFDLSNYPLDEQELTIEVEDKELTEEDLVYVPDRENTRLDPAVRMPGWTAGEIQMRVGSHAYTALGDPTRAKDSEARFSKLVLAIPIQRDGLAIYFKSFLVMFLSVGVGLLGSLLKCQHVEARLGLGLGSIFGVVSSYMVVAQALPESAQFTLADQLHLVGIAFVFLTILLSVVTYHLSGRWGEERAGRLDRLLGLAAAVGFVAAASVVTALH